jgi:hypothetical protein
MTRLFLVILAGLAAWRYRGPIKNYVNQQLPQLQKKASTLVNDAAEHLNTAARSSAGPRENQA